MMDEKLIEKYLKIYPKIKEEINRLDSEYFDILKRREECEKTSMPAECKKGMLETIDAVLDDCSKELRNAFATKLSIDREFMWFNEKEKKVIELRFWNDQLYPTEWSEVAKVMNFHRSYVERIYRKALNKILHSAPCHKLSTN